MTQIIAFVGFATVGKTTASNYVIERYGFVRHNFKDALVTELKEKFPDLLREILELEPSDFVQEALEPFHDYGEEYQPGYIEVKKTIDDLFMHKPPLMRALMQNYGTEVRRGDKPGYWVDKWTTKLWEIGSDVKVVTDDVRFLDEASRVKGQGGIIIRLTRPDLPSGGDHSSETEQLQIKADYTIECEAGDFENLYIELDKIVHESTL